MNGSCLAISAGHTNDEEVSCWKPIEDGGQDGSQKMIKIFQPPNHNRYYITSCFLDDPGSLATYDPVKF